MRSFWALYFWVLLVLVTFFCFCLVFALKISNFLFLKRIRAQRLSHQVACLWGWLLIKLMPIWSLEINGQSHAKAGETYIIIANHQSMSDIWAMFCTGFDFRWIAKDSLFKIPFIGWAMTWCGYISVSRGKRNSHIEAMELSSQHLQEGTSMFFFPEGTRSTDGNLLPFKTGAFRLATQKQVNILPVVLYGAKDLLPKGSWKTGKAKLRIDILNPISIKEHQDISGLTTYCRDRIADALNQHNKNFSTSIAQH